METITDRMLDLHMRHSETFEKLDEQNLKRQTEILKNWFEKTNEHTKNIHSQANLSIYHLGMLAISQALGFALNKDSQELLMGVSKKHLETLGTLFQQHGDKFANVIKEYISYTSHLSPQHRLQYEETQSQQLKQQLDYFNQNQDRIMERILNTLNTILQFEKQISVPN